MAKLSELSQNELFAMAMALKKENVIEEECLVSKAGQCKTIGFTGRCDKSRCLFPKLFKDALNDK